jgi:hypothetical protein
MVQAAPHPTMPPPDFPCAPKAQPLRARRVAAHASTVVLLVASLAGCIVVPRSADVYDPTCRTYVKQIVLETEVIGTLGHCHNDTCAVMLASMGIITAASAVIAGSVAVIGNVAYWAERRGQCPGDPQAGPAGTPRGPATP